MHTCHICFKSLQILDEDIIKGKIQVYLCKKEYMVVMENIKIVGKINIHMLLAAKISNKDNFPDVVHCSVPSCRLTISTCAYMESACFITYLGITTDCRHGFSTQPEAT